MADLGAIGTTTGKRVYLIPLDTAWARPFKTNFPTCFTRTGYNNFRTSQYIDQWKEFRGTVKDDTGVGIARRVIAIDTRTGVLFGSTMSLADGTFKMKVPHASDALTVIAVPNTGDQRNAVVKYRVTPVAAA